ncbi:MAG: hypothetical protein VX421_04795 [Pseudomonadota bacterium]|nr:hypothetical protein [Pseudomonadota bacterium]
MAQRLPRVAGLMMLTLLATVAGCTMMGSSPSTLGTVQAGEYTHPLGHFSCPITLPIAGLVRTPLIVDTERHTRSESIPLSQRSPGDWRNNRIVSDITLPSRFVRFEYPSGALIRFSSGKRIQPVERVLHDGFSRGMSWQFLVAEPEIEEGRLVTGLLLVPWFEEGMEYMGVNALEVYRQGQGPDAELWLKGNLLVGEAIHTVNIQLPVTPFLMEGIHPRDLPAIRDHIGSSDNLIETLLAALTQWLQHCRFSELER